MSKKYDSKRGFTLIELLVVIAIIGLLSSIVLASLNSARAKGRDALRISNVQSLKLALELYYDTNGSYPKQGSTDNGYDMLSPTATPTLISSLTPNYIATIPVDPQAGVVNYYVWGSNGASYAILIWTEKLGGYCKTGVNFNPGWWSAIPAICTF